MTALFDGSTENPGSYSRHSTLAVSVFKSTSRWAFVDAQLGNLGEIDILVTQRRKNPGKAKVDLLHGEILPNPAMA